MGKGKLIIRASVILIAFLITFIFLQYRGVRKEVLNNRENGSDPVASIFEHGIESSSGVIESPTTPNYYWTHDDSVDYGDSPKTYIFGFRLDGNEVVNPRKVTLEGVRNLDWEDIGRDKSNKIIVGDIGNNVNRKDYSIYRFIEPKKGQESIKKEDIEEIVFRFPGEVEYNNESLFYADDSFYILTKEYGKTKLFRLPENKIDLRRTNILEFVGEFEFMGDSKLANIMDAATGADISDDEMSMVFNTYKGIFLFKRSEKKTNFFDGEVSYLPLKWDFRKFQYEAITFTNKDKELLLTTEQGQVYQVSVEGFKKIRDSKSTKVFVEEKDEIGQDRQGIIYKIKHVIYLFQVMVMDIIFR
jgi:hypothetical protein